MIADSTQPHPAPLSGNAYLTGEAARLLGISSHKFDRERKAGRIPECVQVGRYRIVPADKIEAIRTRLIEAGRIDPERDRPFVRVPAPTTATV